MYLVPNSPAQNISCGGLNGVIFAALMSRGVVGQFLAMGMSVN